MCVYVCSLREYVYVYMCVCVYVWGGGELRGRSSNVHVHGCQRKRVSIDLVVNELELFVGPQRREGELRGAVFEEQLEVVVRRLYGTVDEGVQKPAHRVLRVGGERVVGDRLERRRKLRWYRYDVVEGYGGGEGRKEGRGHHSIRWY